MEYGRKLAEFRLDRGMTQEELASTIGVSPEDILSWGSCSDYPSQFHLTAVATALRVKISSIIDKDIDERRRRSMSQRHGRPSAWQHLPLSHLFAPRASSQPRSSLP